MPRVVEKQVPILTPQEIKGLRQTAAHYRNGSCAAAVGMCASVSEVLRWKARAKNA